MKKKAKATGAKKGIAAKKGDRYVCDSCGIVVKVDEICGCNPCDITCCGEDMRFLSCC